MVKNLPSSAGDSGSILNQGTKISHAAGQLSLDTATPKTACSRGHVPEKEKPMNCN